MHYIVEKNGTIQGYTLGMDPEEASKFLEQFDTVKEVSFEEFADWDTFEKKGKKLVQSQERLTQKRERWEDIQSAPTLKGAVKALCEAVKDLGGASETEAMETITRYLEESS